MTSINIIAVGKLKEKQFAPAMEDYLKRISGYCRTCVTEIKEARLPQQPSENQISAAIEQEGSGIMERIDKRSFVVAMCIEGILMSSEQLSEVFRQTEMEQSGNITFVIGGSWGLSDRVKNTARLRLSMSRMTFPHQLARVMLAEQIYRALQIMTGGKYHK
ncbi:MAG: 23S rRNA (pseudouridine(1915)-N(3))-methyltransferase RlmH [Clostridia bacterium]|nr:23S rRNA (pseudouridine(1915)-N(3))-methyltransferase RlmH [Clostridia bacterium]